MMPRRDAHRRRVGESAVVHDGRAFLDFRERSMKSCSEAQAILRTPEKRRDALEAAHLPAAWRRA